MNRILITRGLMDNGISRVLYLPVKKKIKVVPPNPDYRIKIKDTHSLWDDRFCNHDWDVAVIEAKERLEKERLEEERRLKEEFCMESATSGIGSIVWTVGVIFSVLIIGIALYIFG